MKLRWILGCVVVASAVAATSVAWAGKGKPGGGGGGGTSPLDALPGTVVFLVNPNASNDVWYAMNPNGTNLRQVPVASDQGLWDVSVSPHPLHAIVMQDGTQAYSVRPLESSGSGVPLFTHLAPYYVLQDSVRFRYRDPNAGGGPEIDAVAFCGYDTSNYTGWYYYSVDLVRDASGNVTGAGAVEQLAPAPLGGSGPAADTGPDGTRLVYGTQDPAPADGRYNDAGLVTYDVTAGSTTAYPAFDAETWVRGVLWAPTPAKDLWLYEIKPGSSGDCTKETRLVVVADVAQGTTTTVASSTLCADATRRMAAWSPDGTYVALRGGRRLRGGSIEDLYLVPANASASPVKVSDTASLGGGLGRVFWGARIAFGNLGRTSLRTNRVE